jgi:hypothetical protein
VGEVRVLGLFLPPQELSMEDRRQWSRAHSMRASFGFVLPFVCAAFLLFALGTWSLLTDLLVAGGIAVAGMVAFWLGLRLDAESWLERRAARRR